MMAARDVIEWCVQKSRNRRSELLHADKDENWVMRGFDSPRMPLILRILTDFY